jgi:hypothetical protein
MADEQQVRRVVEEAVSLMQGTLLDRLDTMIGARMDTMKTEVTTRQQSIADHQIEKINELKYQDSYNFKWKRNEEQYKVNARVGDTIREAQKELAVIKEQSENAEKASKFLDKGTELIKHRQKLIKLADSSDNGWQVVQEYETHELAENSEDEKRILRATARAESKTKSKFKKTGGRAAPYNAQRQVTAGHSNYAAGADRHPQTTRRNRPGVCFRCGEPGHWQSDCSRPANAAFKASTVNVNVNNDLQEFVNYGSLRKCVEFWRHIVANEFIIDIIQEGYKLPLISDAEKLQLSNNKSAVDNSNFVTQAIQKLLRTNCIKEVKEVPHIVNPLTVAQDKSGKFRLILDCRHLNEHLAKFSFRYEDSHTALDMIIDSDFMYTFDLKSAYHHITIYESHTKYLGFSWNNSFYIYKVLPFGIATASYIFTKITRVLVKHWRESAMRIIMFLDDGIGFAKDRSQADINAMKVKRDLVCAGFSLATDKCMWYPSQKIEWLGYSWDSSNCIVSVNEKRIKTLEEEITKMLTRVTQDKIILKTKSLASLAGKISSTKLVTGNLTSLRTRYIYKSLNQRVGWYGSTFVGAQAIEEFRFWKNEIRYRNKRAFTVTSFKNMSIQCIAMHQIQVTVVL